MSHYAVFTDSACDMLPETLTAWGVSTVSLTFRFDGEEKEYANDEMPAEQFYAAMREGKVAKTAAVNTATFVEAFEPELKKGNDVLYLGFSSGLSNTYNASRVAAEQLRETYPDQKILTVDSLAASAGFGLLLYLMVEKKKVGATIEESAQFAEDTKLKLCHWFTVDDLVYLKRGGRVSPAVALVGNMLGIKPVMHVDNEGHLVKVSQVRGRKASLAALADKLKETMVEVDNGVIYISHGDCADDVETLKGMIKERCGKDVDMVVPVGTVIGAHSGPGTMALFFVGTER